MEALGISLNGIIAYVINFALLVILLRIFLYLFGKYDRFMIAVFHILCLGFLYWAGIMAKLGVVYFAGLAIALSLAAWQQWLIRDRQGPACFRAFLNNNWFGAAVFAGLFISLTVQQ